MDPHPPPPDRLDRVLLPLVRLLVARGVTFPVLAARLKRLYLAAAEREAAAQGAKVTDSRLSVLTGLQRRDIVQIRAEDTPTEGAPTPNPFARLVSHWRQVPPYGADGEPRVLPRRGPAPSFEALAREIRRDVHPRTVLDHLMSAGTVVLEGETVRLIAPAYLPGAGSEAQLAYLADNLGDHAAVAVANVLGADPPRFERAVHFNRMPAEALAEIAALAEARQQALLEEIAAVARARQAPDDPTARGRFRLGAYLFRKDDAE
ncbi:MAG: DUF6502 family protein [Pseudomonadota bacterium]